MNPGPDGSNPIGLTAVGNALYFAAFDEVNGYELWRSTSPPELVANLNTGSSSLPQILGEADGKVIFSAESNDGDRTLYTSSGPGFVSALQAAGVIFNPTTNMSLTEGGTAITYSVKLATKPSNVVTLSLAGNPSQVLLSSSTLTFTSTNWNQEQQVTITAINDLIAESALTINITHTLSSADAIYGALGREDFEVQLLQIILKANVNTGLSQRVVSYMGHAMGEVDGSLPYRLSTIDVGLVRQAVGNAIVSVNDNRDIDKDRRITTLDVGFLRARVANTVLLSNITIPASGSASEC